MMINVNKKLILFFSMASITHFSKSQTIFFSRELSQEQEVSLFLLVEDMHGDHLGGVFEIDRESLTHTIHIEDLQSLNDETLALEGEAVAVVDSCDTSLMNQDMIFFEIADDLTVIKALLINKSLLAEHFISVVEIPLDDISYFDDLDDCGFGDSAVQKEMIARNVEAPQKHFSVSQWRAFAKIGLILMYEKSQRVYASLNKNAKRAIDWLTQYSKKTL